MNVPDLHREASAVVTAPVAAERRHRQLLEDRRAVADRLMIWVLLSQWAFAIGLAVVLSPWSWVGADRALHWHVKLAVVGGGLLNSLPIALALKRPGWWLTRQVVSVAQMLWSALLIHLTGGRIETHFHIFGSLAFLSFYRDWKVFPTATLVVLLDHGLRGFFFPESIYGAPSVEWWRFLEHGAWVLFEVLFLSVGCINSVRDLREVAEREAAYDQANATLTIKVQNRTAALRESNLKLRHSFEELGKTQRQLVDASRRAGMAEVATSVLHNVGNVLNSLNVSANMVSEALERSPSLGIVRVSKLVTAHISDLFDFLDRDERGRQLPNYLDKLAEAVSGERERLLNEMRALQKNIDHVKTIVSMQQSHAKFGGLTEELEIDELLAHAIALTINQTHDGITLEHVASGLPALAVDRHRVTEIVVNLLQNARRAVASCAARRISVTATRRDDGWLSITVTDSGVGISPENLGKIFNHGFTTWENGHGFGLHGSANAATAMNGQLTVHSDGPGQGATFTLAMPPSPVQRVELAS